MIRVKLLFFATLRDRAGVREAQFDLPDGIRVRELKNFLVERFPGLSTGMASVVVAVNREFAFDDQAIPDQAEIALFPPVSGG
jgi:molybdopterin converting factor subunit 1